MQQKAVIWKLWKRLQSVDWSRSFVFRRSCLWLSDCPGVTDPWLWLLYSLTGNYPTHQCLFNYLCCLVCKWIDKTKWYHLATLIFSLHYSIDKFPDCLLRMTHYRRVLDIPSLTHRYPSSIFPTKSMGYPSYSNKSWTITVLQSRFERFELHICELFLSQLIVMNYMIVCKPFGVQQLCQSGLGDKLQPVGQFHQSYGKKWKIDSIVDWSLQIQSKRRCRSIRQSSNCLLSLPDESVTILACKKRTECCRSHFLFSGKGGIRIPTSTAHKRISTYNQCWTKQHGPL